MLLLPWMVMEVHFNSEGKQAAEPMCGCTTHGCHVSKCHQSWYKPLCCLIYVKQYMYNYLFGPAVIIIGHLVLVSLALTEPTFISANWIQRSDDPHNEKIYVFFREKNSDNSPEADPWISRVARVCKVRVQV